jgi:hypothetical protein
MICLRVALNTIGSHCGGGVDHDILSIKNGEGKEGMKTKTKTLEEWFTKAAQSGRGYLTVPPHITTLPCGCSRRPQDKHFMIHRIIGMGWSHVNCLNQGEALALPDVVVQPKVEVRRRDRVYLAW